MTELGMRERDYQLLELSSGASKEEVIDAYQKLLLRYGTGSLASYGLLKVEERSKLLQALKDAASRLLEPYMDDDEDFGQDWDEPLEPAPPHHQHKTQLDGYHATTPAETEVWQTDNVDEHATKASLSRSQSPESAVASSVQVSTEFPTRRAYDGAYLKELRLQSEIELDALADAFHVEEELLSALETHTFDVFPTSRQLRRLLESYADLLHLDRQQVLADYLSDYWSWRTSTL